MDFQRGFKARANRIALAVRAKLGLRDTAPIDPAEICTVYDIALLQLSDVVDSQSTFLTSEKGAFSAVTVPYGWGTAIVHNDTHHPYRQRSNICHELAHCFLGHECVPPLTEAGNRVHDGSVEGEANYLAGCLLIPNEAATYIVRAGLVQAAQGIYGVSQSMLNYRLRMSGAYKIHERYVTSRR